MAQNNDNNGYWEKAKKEIFDFFLWILRRGISWFKTIVRWFEKAIGAVTHWFESSVGSTVHWIETLTKEVSDEVRPHVLMIVVAALGAGIYFLQRMIPLPGRDGSILGAAAVLLFLVSIIGILIGAAQPNSDKLGVTPLFKRLRNKVFKLFSIRKAYPKLNAGERTKLGAKQLAKKDARPKTVARESRKTDKDIPNDGSESKQNNDTREN